MITVEQRLHRVAADVEVTPTDLHVIETRARRRRRRRHLRYAAASAVVLVAVVALGSVTQRDRTTGVTTAAPSNPTGPALTAAATTTRRFTIPGAGRYELAAPASFGLASLPVVGAGAVTWNVGSDCCSRRFEIHTGTPGSIFGDALVSAETSQDAHGNPAYIVTGGSPRLYPNSPIVEDIIAVGVGDQTVTIVEPRPDTGERPMTHNERLDLLAHLQASPGPGGTVDVTATAPLSITIVESPSVDYGPGDLTIAGRPCTADPNGTRRGQWVTRPAAGNTTELCDPNLGLTLRISDRLAATGDIPELTVNRTN